MLSMSDDPVALFRKRMYDAYGVVEVPFEERDLILIVRQKR